jgi:hypothetical protein
MRCSYHSLTIGLVCFVLVASSAAPADEQTFTTNLSYSGGFHIYGYPPVPQVDGFDYYFTPDLLDTSLAGQTVEVTGISITVSGQSLGDVVNWDLEAFIGPTDSGLPTGQFIQTLVDPVAGYPVTSPVYYHLTTQETQFTTSYQFPTDETSDIDLVDGLHTSLFFWTADNRDCDISFDSSTLSITGVIVPEPATGSTLLIVAAAVLMRRRRSGKCRGKCKASSEFRGPIENQS